MSKTRKLFIYKDGVHIQTVTYVKANGFWAATHFFRDKYIPFALHEPLSYQKECLIKGGFTWEWI